jgi:hypothetical protein
VSFGININIISMQQLKLSETLYCIRTAAHILCGEGQAIDVDLQKFYKALYTSIPNICFQSDHGKKNDVDL